MAILDWDKMLRRLATYPPEVHRVLPPCPEKRLQSIQMELGTMPHALLDMLRHFNGARLVITCGPFVSIFGISTIPPLPPLEWAPDWYIDKFTPAWRKSHDRKDDWVIAITNYGGLIILDERDTISEWDTSQRIWGPTNMSPDQWLDNIFQEGDLTLTELTE